MAFIKDLKEVNKQLKEVLTILDKETIYKAKKYDDLTSLLKKIKISAKVQKAIDENGDKYLNISYNIPNVVLKFDEKGSIIKNELFYSINMLDLLDNDSIKKIKESLEQIKK